MDRPVYSRILLLFLPILTAFALTVRMTPASNIGFRFNKGLQLGFTAPGPKADNWLAMPWVSPTSTYTALCNALAAQGFSKANVTLQTIDPTTGNSTSVNCLIGSATGIPAGRAVRMRVIGTAGPSSVILSGSHDDTIALPTIVGGFVTPGPKGDNWLSIPYHTTWKKASDVCTALGATLASGTNISRIDPFTGNTTVFTCGLSQGTSSNFVLAPGEGIRIRKSTAGSFAGVFPPHY